MDGTAHTITRENLGAWLVKAAGGAPSTGAHVRAGFTGVETWCVRPTYRTELVESGQRVLLWVSGSAREHPAGIYAQGRTMGAVVSGVVPLALEPLENPLLRSELLGHPGLATLEVLRMPAGSNPSFVTPEQLLVLAQICPELRS